MKKKHQHRLFRSLSHLESVAKPDRQKSFSLYRFGGFSLLTLLGLLLTPLSARAVPVTLTFNSPTCVTNAGATCLAVGSVWRFSNVVTGATAGSQRDALLTISSAVGGATVTNINTAGGFQNVNFQPTIRSLNNANISSYVIFNIQFVTPGTLTPVTIGGEVYETAFDVDGNGVANSLREMVEFGTSFGTYLAAPTSLVVDPTPFTTGGTRYIINNSSDVFSGITNNPVYEATALYPASTNSFNLLLGSKVGSTSCGGACDRQSSISFRVADVVPINDLTVAKSHTGNFIAGVPASYTITTTNYGALASSGTITIKDTLPTGLTIVDGAVSISGANAGAWTCNALANVITCTSNTSIALQGTSIFNINNIIVSTTAIPSVTNSVTISGGSDIYTQNNTATDLATVSGVSVSGKVWNDIDGSGNGGFNLITTPPGEVGTNANNLGLYAILIDGSAIKKVIGSVAIAADGSYSFSNLAANQTGLTIELSTSAGALNSTIIPPQAVPTGWKSTAPKITTAFNVVLTDIINKYFGIAQPANAILVKRITAINGLTTNPNDTSKVLTAVIDSGATTNDDPAKKWPVGYLKGLVDAGEVKPGDTIEYTIYYLNDGNNDAKALKICDPIRGRQTYTAGSMQLLPGGVTDTVANRIALTDLVDLTVDRANSYTTGNAPTDCNAGSTTVTGNDRGGVAIQLTGTGATPQPNLTVLPGATLAGTPTTSYGWFRFTTTVDP
jgi:uncharacterized repeat protein (TIGR01451 family)